MEPQRLEDGTALITENTASPPPMSSEERRFYGRRFLLAVPIVAGLVVVIIFWSQLRTSLEEQYIGGCTVIGGQETCASKTLKAGIVASSHYLATKAAMDVLEKGGNAADAAAVLQFMLNVVQPMSTGIGGGCFIMIYNSTTNQVFSIDGREEAPNAFHPNAFCAEDECMLTPEQIAAHRLKYKNNNDENDPDFDIDSLYPICNCSSGPVSYSERYVGGQGVGVPGVLRAFDRLMKDFGSISMQEAFQPAINKAREGFLMYPDMVDRIMKNIARLARFESSSLLLLNESRTGPRVKVGELFQNPDLADTFELLAQKGIDEFYEGVIADEIVSTVRNAVNTKTGKFGVMAKDDLQSYRAVYRVPVHTRYRGYDVWGMNMPSSGGTTIAEALNIIEGFHLSLNPSNPWPSQPATPPLDSLQFMIDSQNIAWADRDKYAADADFVDVPQVGLSSKQYAKQRRDQQFKSIWTGVSIPVPPGVPPDTKTATRNAIELDNGRHGTTHFSILDRWGNAISCTTTIENNFGSGVVVPGRGFLLNNELTDFSARERDENGNLYPNRPQGGKRLRRTAVGGDAESYGGKRPRSSMSPTLVIQDGSVVLSVGAAGGSHIIGCVFDLLIYVLDFKMSITSAMNADRIQAMNSHPMLERDLFLDRVLVDELRARGYIPFPTSGTFNDPGAALNIAQGFQNSSGLYVGASDPRFPASAVMVR